jgi:hypothetical protein
MNAQLKDPGVFEGVQDYYERLSARWGSDGVLRMYNLLNPSTPETDLAEVRLLQVKLNGEE